MQTECSTESKVAKYDQNVMITKFIVNFLFVKTNFYDCP